MSGAKKLFSDPIGFLFEKTQIDRLDLILLNLLAISMFVSFVTSFLNPPQKICADKGGVYSASEKICVVTKEK